MANWQAMSEEFGQKMRTLCQSSPNPEKVSQAVSQFVQDCMTAAYEYKASRTQDTDDD